MSDYKSTCLPYLAQRTEIKFDLESPVVELGRQIRMEFDFLHEARVMDAVGRNLQVLSHTASCMPLFCGAAGLLQPPACPLFCVPVGAGLYQAPQSAIWRWCFPEQN